MITDDDLREIIASNEALEPGNPMRNERSLEMARECLDGRTIAGAVLGGSPLRRRETSTSIALWQNETFGPATTTWQRVYRSDEAMRGAMWHASVVAGDRNDDLPRPNLSRAIRAAEELAELIELLVTDDNAAKAPEEVADIDIVLRGIDAAHGVERADQVDAKMAKNRARTWATTGDGHGQHVKDAP